MNNKIKEESILSKFQQVIHTWWQRNWKVLVFALALFAIWMTIRKNFDAWINKMINLINEWNEYWFIAIIVGTFTIIIHRLWKKSKENGYLPSTEEKILLLTMVLIYGFYRFFDDEYLYWGIGWFAWMDLVFVVLIAYSCNEVVLLYKYFHTSTSSIDIDRYPFIVDVPNSEDDYKRKSYATSLADKIIATFMSDQLKERAFSILLSERFGIGKTSFFKMLDIEFKARNIDIICFKPWLDSGEDKIITNYLRLLQSKFSRNDKTLQNLLNVYSRFITHNPTKSFIQGVTTLFSPVQSLEEIHDEIKTKLNHSAKPIVVLIDDVDRLFPNELLTILRLIRNTVDFPNIVYVVAADKEAMLEMLQDIHIKTPSVYLEKFFDFELLFPAHENQYITLLKDEIEKLMMSHTSYAVEKLDLAIRHLTEWKYFKVVFKSPRDIKRYLNILNFAVDNLERNQILSDVYLADLFMICVLEYIDSNTYKLLRDQNETILSYSIISSKYALTKEVESSCMTEDEFQQIQLFLDEKTDTSSKQKERSIHNGLYQTMKSTQPSLEEVVAGILYNLFNDNVGAPTNRICYSHEYFKYFAASYRKDEVSNAESKAIIELSISEYGQQLLSNTFSYDKCRSLEHKYDWYISTYKFSKIDILNKLIILFETLYSHEKTLSLLEYFNQCSDIKYYIMNLYGSIQEYSEQEREDEYKKLNLLIINDKRYGLLALILSAISEIDSLHYHVVFTKEQVAEWSNDLMIRLFLEAIEPTPLEYLEELGLFKHLQLNLWIEHYSILVNRSQYPLQWLYWCFKYNNGTCSWNKKVVECLIDKDPFNDTLSEYSKKFFSSYLSPEEVNDILKLHLESDISKLDIEDHVILKNVRDWWLNKKLSRNLKEK